ncbi:uncharacterized protein LOC113147412, partial [Cyclospora cayetanensis]|uniref:Uncharacterized protein LOC113147412 n=1 Tax=Cyclospora cayetanensis TaxID=88456 RepID=A0A6P6S0T2_9EIME
MEEATAVLQSLLEDSGHEVTAITLSVELQVPLITARKLLYAHVQQRLQQGEPFFVSFAGTDEEGITLHRVLLSSPTMPPLECLYSAQLAAVGEAEGTEAAKGTISCCRKDGPRQLEVAHLSWQMECRALAAAFSSQLQLQQQKPQHQQQLFVPPFASVRLQRLMRRNTSRAATPAATVAAVAATAAAAARKAHSTLPKQQTQQKSQTAKAAPERSNTNRPEISQLKAKQPDINRMLQKRPTAKAAAAASSGTAAASPPAHEPSTAGASPQPPSQ